MSVAQDGQLSLPMTNPSADSDAYLLLTNREGLLEALSAGTVKPGPLPKGNRHLSDITHNSIPLLTVSPWKDLITETTDIGSNSFPVIIEFPKSIIRRGEWSIDFRGDVLADVRGALCVLKGGMIPISSASAFYVSSHGDIKRLSARFGSFRREALSAKLTVDERMFTGMPYPTQALLEAVRKGDARVTPLKDDLIKRAEALAGGLQLLAGLTDREGLPVAPVATALRATQSGRSAGGIEEGTALFAVAVKSAEPHSDAEIVDEIAGSDNVTEGKLTAVIADYLATVSPDVQDDLTMFREISDCFREQISDLENTTVRALEVIGELLNSMTDIDTARARLTPVTMALWYVLRNPSATDWTAAAKQITDVKTKQLSALLYGMRAKRRLIAVDLRPGKHLEDFIDTYVVWNLNRPYHGTDRREANINISEAKLLIGNMVLLGGDTHASISKGNEVEALGEPLSERSHTEAEENLSGVGNDTPQLQASPSARQHLMEDEHLAVTVARAAGWHECITTAFVAAPEVTLYTKPQGKKTAWVFDGYLQPEYRINITRLVERMERMPNEDLEVLVRTLSVATTDESTAGRRKTSGVRRLTKKS